MYIGLITISMFDNKQYLYWITQYLYVIKNSIYILLEKGTFCPILSNWIIQQRMLAPEYAEADQHAGHGPWPHGHLSAATKVWLTALFPYHVLIHKGESVTQQYPLQSAAIL